MQDDSVDSRLLRSVAKGLSQICPRHERRPALEPAVVLNPNFEGFRLVSMAKMRLTLKGAKMRLIDSGKCCGMSIKGRSLGSLCFLCVWLCHCSIMMSPQLDHELSVARSLSCHEHSCALTLLHNPKLVAWFSSSELQITSLQLHAL